MTQARSTTVALLGLDAISVMLAFNLVAWAWGVVHWSGLLIFPLALPVALHVLAVYLIDGYNPRTDMMSVTYTSQHAIALVSALLLTLLLTYAVISAPFALQVSRLVITSTCLLLIPITLSYRRFFYQRQLAHKQQRYFMFLGSPESCVAFKEECRKTGMEQAVLYATAATFTRSAGTSGTSAA